MEKVVCTLEKKYADDVVVLFEWENSLSWETVSELMMRALGKVV